MLSHKQRVGDPIVLRQLPDQLDPLMKFNIFRKHQELQTRTCEAGTVATTPLETMALTTKAADAPAANTVT